MLLRLLLNKAILVKRVNPEKPGRHGDLIVHDSEIEVHFLWRSEKLNTDKIEQIRAYWNTTLGLEEFWCIDISLANGKTVYLDGSNLEHQKATNDLLLNLKSKPVNFQNLPFNGANKSIVYQKGLQPT
jgi:hypothetical protein